MTCKLRGVENVHFDDKESYKVFFVTFLGLFSKRNRQHFLKYISFHLNCSMLPNISDGLVFNNGLSWE